MGVLLYFVAFRKNDFEQRVARYIPYHAISDERKRYLEKVEKYRRYICNGLAIFFALIFIIPLGYLIALDILKGWMLMQVASWALSPIIFLFWGYYLLSAVVKRNAKAQHLLLEEMSDKDFEYLLKVQKNLSWLRKYFPFFILCKDKLYFFTFFTIREILIRKATERRIAVRLVDRFYPSSKTCSNCGSEHDRDKNAAINLGRCQTYTVLTTV